MLTAMEIKRTSEELKENVSCLAYPLEKIAADTGLDEREIKRSLEVRGANPNHVWMLRDYLEDMLTKEGKELFPFTRLADHAANRWFSYETPWRHGKK